ncbi:MAG: type II toxin-antitoxin system VapC family toxin [Leptospiraceae bacterium]|nr:type II toxin-antitoxin system VapC family toxin [Leptospiraceae bacterium]MCP5493990.1 type II toxin-antitoxin system VapC family toxin [Leptospiraceae bacterium]
MKFLIDTHIFLWYITNDNRLDLGFKNIIIDKTNEIYLSVVSIWEMLIKAKLGKLFIPQPYYKFIVEQLEQHKIDVLAVNKIELVHLESLPEIHKDPFDRIMICQSIEYNHILLTDDNNILKYPIKRLNSQ